MPKIKVNGIIKSTKPYKKRTIIYQAVKDDIDSATQSLEQLQSGLSRTESVQESNQNLDDLDFDDLNEAISKDTGPVVHLCGNKEDCRKIDTLSAELDQEARNHENKTGLPEITEEDCKRIYALINELKRGESNNEQNNTCLSEITSEKVAQPDLLGRS
ncbi:hypothetical protein [Wolbachia endosymbiont of Folsomia candida]|uniref:hypothetical protein n=1 Tax=Wolbachia endosymbiont of Folsomia candida TaxID=169402 RepID=UPI000ADD4F4A|nr:hypothetical protein [Wolbachia endosymbiont of Folsomia candida]APR98398.1 hypothetical protein ASM33_03865 [Wolbachia endosymbiont of Folsomia candida]